MELIRKLGLAGAFALAALFPTTSAAALISLSPASQAVQTGQAVTLDLLYDFSADPTIGGGVDVFYNPGQLQFVSFTFNPGLGDDPLLRRSPDLLPGELNGIAFGEFGGLSGPGVVGSLLFTAIAPGTALIDLAINDSPAGGFVSASTFDPQTVDLLGATVNISAAGQSGSVPIPGTLALMGLGLLLAGMRRVLEPMS